MKQKNSKWKRLHCFQRVQRTKRRRRKNHDPLLHLTSNYQPVAGGCMAAGSDNQHSASH